MSSVAPLVDLLWGGTVYIGPTIKYACGMGGARKFCQNFEPEHKQAWDDTIDAAASLNDGDALGIMIIEYDDGTVKALYTKNYLDLCRRTYPDLYPAALQAVEQDMAAANTSGDSSGGNAGDDASGNADGAGAGAGAGGNEGGAAGGEVTGANEDGAVSA